MYKGGKLKMILQNGKHGCIPQLGGDYTMNTEFRDGIFKLLSSQESIPKNR